MSLKEQILFPFARRFFAGVSLEDALSRIRVVNSQGLGATLDFLGEDVRDRDAARAARSEYARAIEAISAGRLDASIAVKLTHIGLDVGRDLAEANALKLMETAREKGVFVWLDMEGSAHTDDTIRIYRLLHGKHGGGAGIALQASLARTWQDLKTLVPERARIRLVKGAYREPPGIALQRMSDIRAEFMAMLLYLFGNSASFSVGTHDRGLVQKALTYAGDYRGEFEFQMLMGMRDDLKFSLASQGRRVVEYIPYGTEWYGYGMRRLKETRRNAVYMAQGLFGK